MLHRDHFVFPVSSFSEMNEIGWRKLLGFQKTGKPWLTGSYAAGNWPVGVSERHVKVFDPRAERRKAWELAEIEWEAFTAISQSIVLTFSSNQHMLFIQQVSCIQFSTIFSFTRLLLRSWRELVRCFYELDEICKILMSFVKISTMSCAQGAFCGLLRVW